MNNLFDLLHRHRYEVVDVQHVRSGGGFTVTTITTSVLTHCRCGSRRVEHLAGKWTRDQANGHAERTVLELPERTGRTA